MGIINTNELLRFTRVNKKLTQEEVAFGICSVGTLSRYENGDLMPSKCKFDALMNRMGVSPSKYQILLSEREYTLHKKISQIKSLFMKYDYEQALLEINSLHKDIGNAEPLLLQYYLSMKTILEFELYGIIASTKKCLLSALQITLDLNNLSKTCLTQHESLILYYLSKIHRLEQKPQKSLPYLRILYETFTIQYMDNTIYELQLFFRIAYDLINCLVETNQYQEAILYCNLILKKYQNILNIENYKCISNYKKHILHLLNSCHVSE